MKMLLQWVHAAPQNLNSLIWCLNLVVLKSNHPGFAIPIMRFSRLYLQRQRGRKQRGGEGRRKGRGKGGEKGEGGQADASMSFLSLSWPVITLFFTTALAYLTPHPSHITCCPCCSGCYS